MASAELPVLIVFPLVASLWIFVSRDWGLRYAPIGFVLAAGAMIAADAAARGTVSSSTLRLTAFSLIPFAAMLGAGRTNLCRRNPYLTFLIAPAAYFLGVVVTLALSVQLGILTP